MLLDAKLADGRRPTAETKLADAHLSDRDKLEKWKLGRVSRISERRVPDPGTPEEPIGVPPVSQRRTSLVRRCMQVEPIKPALKAPGTKRLELIYDGPLSKFPFNFNLRR
jgi:hypothetical protein